MAMADFNKDNTFIVIMRKEADNVNSESLNMIKMLIVSCITMIVFLLMEWITNHAFNLIAPIIIFLITSILILYKTLKSTRLKEVEEIIYGNKYSVLNINNEEIFDIIQSLNHVKGQMDYCKNIYLSYILIVALLYVIEYISIRI